MQTVLNVHQWYSTSSHHYPFVARSHSSSTSYANLIQLVVTYAFWSSSLDTVITVTAISSSSVWHHLHCSSHIYKKNELSLLELIPPQLSINLT